MILSEVKVYGKILLLSPHSVLDPRISANISRSVMRREIGKKPRNSSFKRVRIAMSILNRLLSDHCNYITFN